MAGLGKYRMGGHGRIGVYIWPDWGNTAWAAMAGLGFIGLKCPWEIAELCTDI